METNDKALREAILLGQVEIVKHFLEHGVDIHANDEKALRLASYYGHTEVVKLLLDAGKEL